MRAIGALIIIIGFVVAGVFLAIYWTSYQVKRLSNKQGRAEIKTEISKAAKVIATDKDFHKDLNKEFKGTYILFGLVAVALLAMALGID